MPRLKKTDDAKADLLILSEIDRLGHFSFLRSYVTEGLLSDASLASLERLCRSGRLRAESFYDACGDEVVWVQRADCFVLPAWAKCRGQALWEE